nr:MULTISPECIES: DUF488 domain-containing protein [unclassified Streptomyces]
MRVPTGRTRTVSDQAEATSGRRLPFSPGQEYSRIRRSWHGPVVARRSVVIVSYRWEQALGGFRKAAPDSPDVIWRNASFRGYAAYTRDPAFVTAMDKLLQDALAARTAVMCSEAVWWRCHRRLIADFAVVARGVTVLHLMHDKRLVAHAPTPGLRQRPDGLLVYDDTAAVLPKDP